MSDIIRFHVPCNIEYTNLVEEVTSQIGVFLKEKTSPKFTQKLRSVMNEVFINVVKHSKTAEIDEIVRFQFEIGMEYFSISIYDFGPGFEAEGHFPPYPKKLIGQKYKIRDVLDGSVYFTISNPLEVNFIFEESDESNLDELEGLSLVEDHGLGISIVTKIMDDVTYSHIGQGKFDWKLIKKLS